MKILFNIFIFFFISCQALSCQNKNKIDNKYTQQISNYKRIKNILLSNKDALIKIKSLDSATVYRNQDIIFGMNKKDLESLFNSRSLKIDSNQTKELIVNSLFDNETDGWIVFRQDNSVEFSVKFYNGGISDSSYYHSIIFDPKHTAKTQCQYLENIQDIEQDWVYRICRTNFN